MESRREHALGRHDVERLEAGNARQQIEVGLVEPFGVGDPVGDGDDDVADRVGGGLGDQPLAQRVLVAAARFAHAALVVAERIGEEPRLDPHPLRRAVDIVGAERLVDQLLEPLHLLRLAPELIVEAQHLGDQSGPEPERQLADRRRRVARAAACAITSRSSGLSRRGGRGSRPCRRSYSSSRVTTSASTVRVSRRAAPRVGTTTKHGRGSGAGCEVRGWLERRGRVASAAIARRNV